LLFFVGIDPGVAGWYVEIDADGNIVCTWQIPTIKKTGNRKEYDIPAIVQWMSRRYNPSSRLPPDRYFCTIEQQQVMPTHGGWANYLLGGSSHMWETVFAFLGSRHQFVKPTVWKRALGVPAVRADKKKGITKRDAETARKAASVQTAKRLFPGVNLRPNPRKKDEDHNLADALLLAEYGRRMYGGGGMGA